MTDIKLPSSTEILTRIRLCREEEAQLKKLLRAALAAERADAARKARVYAREEVADAR